VSSYRISASNSNPIGGSENPRSRRPRRLY